VHDVADLEQFTPAGFAQAVVALTLMVAGVRLAGRLRGERRPIPAR
jgi:hypothetical protein